jgi:hypothetical protein
LGVVEHDSLAASENSSLNQNYQDNLDDNAEASEGHDYSSDGPESHTPALSPPKLPRRPTRSRKPPKIFGSIAKGITSIPVVAHAFLAGIEHSMEESEPHGYREAMASPERKK